MAPDKGDHDGVQKRKQQKISDFFASKKFSPQLKKVRIPPVKKQCLEGDEGNPPTLVNKSEKRVHEEKAQ